MTKAYENTKAWRERMGEEALRAYRREEARKYREAHRDDIRAYRKAYREKNLAKIRAQDAENARKQRSADPEAARRRYEAWYQRKKARELAMAGRPKPEACEICGSSEFPIVWDHCHVSGTFRGWICDRCNKVLGLVSDSPQILSQLQSYLLDQPPIALP